MLYRADLLKEDGQLDEAITHLEANRSFVVDQLSWKMKMAEINLLLGTCVSSGVTLIAADCRRPPPEKSDIALHNASCGSHPLAWYQRCNMHVGGFKRAAWHIAHCRAVLKSTHNLRANTHLVHRPAWHPSQHR